MRPALGVADAQIVLSHGVILLGSFAIPLHRLQLILRDAVALVVAEAQIELSPGVILLGGFAKPRHRFSFILRNAEITKEECHTQFNLGLGIAFFCLGADFGQQFAVRLALLGVQLKSGCTQQQQQKSPYQPIRFHIGRLVDFDRLTSVLWCGGGVLTAGNYLATLQVA